MIAFVDITAILCSIHTVQFQQDKNHLAESASRFEELAKSLVNIKRNIVCSQKKVRFSKN